MEKILKKWVYRRRMSHNEYSLMVSKLDLRSRDLKYYYFLDAKTNKGYKVLKVENGERLDIIGNM